MNRTIIVRAGLLCAFFLCTAFVAGTAQSSTMDAAVKDVVVAMNDLTSVIKQLKTVDDVDRYRNDILKFGERMTALYEKYPETEDVDFSGVEMTERYPDLAQAVADMMGAMIDIGMKAEDVADRLGEVLDEAMGMDGSEEEETED